MFIYSHNQESEGAKALAESLNARRIRRTASKFKGDKKKVVLNWGSSAVTDEVAKCRIINAPAAVALCSDKLEFFKQLGGTDVRTVPFTEDQAVAKQWLEEGRQVCSRTALRGSGGQGLTIFDGHGTFIVAPLYTMYVKKKDEYRVHVCNGEVIDVQRKALKLVKPGERGGRENTRGAAYEDLNKECVPPFIDGQDHRIRNLANGYIFMRNDISPPDDVLAQAKAVFNHIPLDFGAVDVIWNQRNKQAFVLEVNTAPGLEGSTIESYVKAIKALEA